MGLIKRISYREYVLIECQRQWQECQELEGCGNWDSQNDSQKKSFYEDMYQHIWPNRFELDGVVLPEAPEADAWERIALKREEIT